MVASFGRALQKNVAQRLSGRPMSTTSCDASRHGGMRAAAEHRPAVKNRCIEQARISPLHSQRTTSRNSAVKQSLDKQTTAEHNQGSS
jgi:hypothetical protein